MSEPRTILITGVTSAWGRRVAARLGQEPGVRLIGLDVLPAERAPTGLDYVQSDPRQRGLPALLRDRGVEIVCHLAYRSVDRHSEAAFEHNVMGTIHLFGACAKAGVRRIVARSSTMVYGALPDNPALLVETAPLRASRDHGECRYLVEMEQFYDGFHHTAPEVKLAILRFANIVGPTADTPMTRFLAEPRAPVLLGFDPLLQFIHEDDVVEALAQAAIGEIAGPVNVAATPSLPLTRALALAQKIPVVVPHPLAYWSTTFLGDSERLAPLPWDYLRYRWVADTSRLETDWGFLPAVGAEEALRAFVAAGRQPVAELWREALAQGRQWRERLERLRARGGEEEA